MKQTLLGILLVGFIGLAGPTVVAQDVGHVNGRVPDLWDAHWTSADGTAHLGVTGDGVVVLRGEGYDGTHPDLRDCADADHQRKSGVPAPFTDSYSGHGTLTTAVICSSGEMSDGRYRGVAPDAEVFADSGPCVHLVGVNNCPRQSDWYHETEHNVRIASFSYGDIDPNQMETWQHLWGLHNEDILYTNGAGNYGGDGSQNQVSCGRESNRDPKFICVAGAIASRDALADGSSRGDKDDRDTWPRITAPMCMMVSSRMPSGGMLGGPPSCPLPPQQTPVETLGWYTQASGTSIASPFVAGVAALVFQVNPGLTAPEAVYLITRTADPFLPTEGLPEAGRAARAEAFFEVHGYAAGYGFVNATAAVAAAHYMALDPDATPQEAVECFSLGRTPLGTLVLNPDGPETCVQATHAHLSDLGPTSGLLPGLVGLLVVWHSGRRTATGLLAGLGGTRGDGVPA